MGEVLLSHNGLGRAPLASGARSTEHAPVENHIRWVLGLAEYDVVKASVVLGLSVAEIRRRMEELGISEGEASSSRLLSA